MRLAQEVLLHFRLSFDLLLPPWIEQYLSCLPFVIVALGTSTYDHNGFTLVEDSPPLDCSWVTEPFKLLTW